MNTATWGSFSNLRIAVVTYYMRLVTCLIGGAHNSRAPGCRVVLNVCGSSVCNSVHGVLRAPGVFRWLLGICGPEWLSRYSDWLRAGRSGDRIPARAGFSPPVQTGSGAHPTFCTMGTRSFPGVKRGRGVTLTLHPLLVPWS